MNCRLTCLAVMLVAAVLTGAASGREDSKKLPDEQINKLLVGNWTFNESNKDIKITGKQEFAKDGKFKAEATIAKGQETTTITISGTWTVKDGNVIETIAKSSLPDFVKAGTKITNTVISLDDSTYKFKSDQNVERTLKRVKD